MKDAWRINAGTIKMQEGRHKKTSLTKYIPLSLFVRFAFERMLETEHKLYILTPLLWPSRCVVLVLLMLGSTPSGLPRTPRSGVAFLTTSGLSCLEVYWQLLWGFSECPLGRVWLSLPHLVSPVWESAGNYFGGFPSAPSVGCGLPYHIWSVCISPGNCFGTPNSTELNNNSTPTRSPTGSLNRMFNRHQAEITVMQFRGYSLPVHDCNGRMGPWPYPIS